MVVRPKSPVQQLSVVVFGLSYHAVYFVNAIRKAIVKTEWTKDAAELSDDDCHIDHDECETDD